MKSTYNEVTPYITKDGSEIRELMHPLVHSNKAQSLAEATILPGGKTLLHRHEFTEEIYHVTAGAGWMTLGDEQFPLQSGDTVSIPSKTAHCVENRGRTPLKILCVCVPAYSHEDTELL